MLTPPRHPPDRSHQRPRRPLTLVAPQIRHHHLDPPRLTRIRRLWQSRALADVAVPLDVLEAGALAQPLHDIGLQLLKGLRQTARRNAVRHAAIVEAPPDEPPPPSRASRRGGAGRATNSRRDRTPSRTPSARRRPRSCRKQAAPTAPGSPGRSGHGRTAPTSRSQAASRPPGRRRAEQESGQRTKPRQSCGEKAPMCSETSSPDQHSDECPKRVRCSARGGHARSRYDPPPGTHATVGSGGSPW
jgi:hypothetical protein